MLVKILFWVSVAGILYAWVVYPVVLLVLSRVMPNRNRSQQVASDQRSEWPSVSIVIAAYKEESVILERLRNTSQLNYPLDQLEVLIGCDGDEDATGEIVRGYDDPRVRLVQYPQRRGKASVLNDTVPQATGQIVVFSDANTNMNPDALKKLIRHFDDPAVGGVCGQLVLTDPETGKNVDGVYWRFENFLKSNEARLGALLGVNGAIYAIRKELYSPIPSNTIVDDFLIGMRIHLRKLKLIYEPDAKAFEETAPSISGEYSRRVRIGAGNLQCLQWLSPLLNPKRGMISLVFLSHKVMRWLCPVLMLIALITNIILVGELSYGRMLGMQILFYTMAIVGLQVGAGSGWKKLFRLPAMFVAMNVALLMGAFRLLGTNQSGTWKRTERTPEAQQVRT